MKRRTAMISKTKIGVILSSAMVASAMVCFGIAHRHHQIAAAVTTVNQHVDPIPTTPKPPAGKPLDASDDQNQTDAANDPNTSSQQTADSADNLNQNQSADGQADAGNSDQGQAADVTAQQQTASYAVTPVRVKSVASVKVVRPVVAASTVSLDHPVASIARASRSAIIVPTGTELAFRLAEPLGSKISQPEQSFAGTLDRDIDINGHTVIAAGARVTGKVVAARPAGLVAGEATLQLQVTSVKVKNHELAVLTSVRSFGPTINGKNKVGRFFKGIGKRVDGEEREVRLDDQTAYSFNLSGPLEIR
jgi:hypothetical protein